MLKVGSGSVEKSTGSGSGRHKSPDSDPHPWLKGQKTYYVSHTDIMVDMYCCNLLTKNAISYKMFYTVFYYLVISCKVILSSDAKKLITTGIMVNYTAGFFFRIKILYFTRFSVKFPISEI